MIGLQLKHLICDKDRHGNLRYYVRVQGAKKRRIREDPSSPAFFQAYIAARDLAEAEAAGRVKRQRWSKGTIGWLVTQYLKSGAFTDLDEGTQLRRRRMLEEFRTAYGFREAGAAPRTFMLELMDTWKKDNGPHGANNRLKAIRGLYGWALKRELIKRNITQEVTLFAPHSEGFHTWTPAEIRKFMGRWELGTAPRVAMTVMFCTGARLGDAYRIGPGNVYRRRGQERLRFTPTKTGKTSGIVVDIPMVDMLVAAIAAGPTSAETFIVGTRGRPFKTKESFGTAFKNWCKEAGLPHCSAHGLRKGGAALLSERGLTPSQLQAIYGWTNLRMPELYTRKADRARQSDVLIEGFHFDEEEDEGSDD